MTLPWDRTAVTIAASSVDVGSPVSVTRSVCLRAILVHPLLGIWPFNVIPSSNFTDDRNYPIALSSLKLRERVSNTEWPATFDEEYPKASANELREAKKSNATVAF